jgi:hypothetical protein
MGNIQYIGHGKLESSPENFSILHVVSHELGHVQEFKNEAFRENRDITDIRVKIDWEMRPNGQIVAVSGETSATTRAKSEKNQSLEPYSGPKFPLDPKATGLGNPNGEKKPAEMDPKSSDTEKSPKEKIDSHKEIREINLMARKESLEARLKQVNSELEAIQASRRFQSSQIGEEGNRQSELERERRKMEEELRILRLEENTQKNFQFLSEAQRKIMENSFSLGVDNAGIRLGLPGNKSGSLLDTFS